MRDLHTSMSSLSLRNPAKNGECRKLIAGGVMREAGASIRQQKGEGWRVLRVGKYQSQPQLKFLLYQLSGIFTSLIVAT